MNLGGSWYSGVPVQDIQSPQFAKAPKKKKLPYQSKNWNTKEKIKTYLSLGGSGGKMGVQRERKGTKHRTLLFHLIPYSSNSVYK